MIFLSQRLRCFFVCFIVKLEATEECGGLSRRPMHLEGLPWHLQVAEEGHFGQQSRREVSGGLRESQKVKCLVSTEKRVKCLKTRKQNILERVFVKSVEEINTLNKTCYMRHVPFYCFNTRNISCFFFKAGSWMLFFSCRLGWVTTRVGSAPCPPVAPRRLSMQCD